MSIARASEDSHNPGVASDKGALRPLMRVLHDSPVPFSVTLPDGEAGHFGQGDPQFRIYARNRDGQRALLALDEGRLGDAYVHGDLDIEGSIAALFLLRQKILGRSLKDFHPLANAWRFLHPLIFGQVKTNRVAIGSHYEIPPEFFLTFMDRETPAYTQGVFLADDEPLSVATTRKFDYVYEKLGLEPGDHVLDIGPGWGAWFHYASQRGIRCSGITISEESRAYLTHRGQELGYEWDVTIRDLLETNAPSQYDGVVMMGVIEHLPHYDKLARRLGALLKPGRRMFVDGSASAEKYQMSSFITKHVFPKNHSFLVLHEFVKALADEKLFVEEVISDRRSYYLTCRHWAENLEAHRDSIVAKFGEANFRRFRLYLWGAAHEFLSGGCDCYRLVIHKPDFPAEAEPPEVIHIPG